MQFSLRKLKPPSSLPYQLASWLRSKIVLEHALSLAGLSMALEDTLLALKNKLRCRSSYHYYKRSLCFQA